MMHIRLLNDGDQSVAEVPTLSLKDNKSYAFYRYDHI